MKEATTVRHLNVPNKGLFNRPRSLLYPYLNPKQNQIVAAAQRKLSRAAKTAGGKLALPLTSAIAPSTSQLQAPPPKEWDSQCFW